MWMCACGHMNPDDAEVCLDCGGTEKAIQTEIETEAEPEPEAEPEEAPLRKNRIKK